MDRAMIQCSTESRLLLKADADRLGMRMSRIADEYIKVGRKFYQKTVKQASKSKKEANNGEFR